MRHIIIALLLKHSIVIFQGALISFVDEQRNLIKEASIILEEFYAQISSLSVDNVCLSSELVAANGTVKGLSAENVRLSSALAAASETEARLNAEKIHLSSELEAVSETVAGLTADNVRLSSELVAANGAVARLDSERIHFLSDLVAANGAVATSACENTRLRSEVNAIAEELESKTYSFEGMKSVASALSDLYEDAKGKYTQALEDRKATQKHCDGLVEKLDKEMSRPKVPCGTFECIVNAVQFAESACDEKHDGTDWDHSELKHRVVSLVKNMTVAEMRRCEFDEKVHEVCYCLYYCLYYALC